MLVVQKSLGGKLRANLDYAGAFRRLYYHLYSNSRASRAERIIEDLSKLLLCKLACDRSRNNQILSEYVLGGGSANGTLLPALAEAFPGLFSEADSFSIGDDALRHGLAEILELDLAEAPAHIIGDAFQALIGPRLRGEKGQFFTPRALAKAMVEILDPQPGERIVDPACGTGGFLSEAHSYQTQRASTSPFGTLLGIDIDKDMWRLASALLAITTRERAVVLNKDSLDVAELRDLPEETSPFQADMVLTNPPFGSRIGIKKPSILQQFSLGHRWSFSLERWRQTTDLLGAQDPQILFIELCIRLLKPGGRLGIVLPEGVFGNRGYGYIWDYLRSVGKIIALLDCPRTTFQPSTDTKTNVLFFEKRQADSLAAEDDSQQVWIAVALNCGHDRRGRTVRASGDPYPNDFERIGPEFRQRESVRGSWFRGVITHRYYLVPRYYQKLPEAELTELIPGWKGGGLVSIQEMCRRGFLRIRKGHEVGAEAYGTGDIPFVRTSDVSNWEVSVDPTKCISDEVYRQYAPQQDVHPNDILLVVDGRYRIGRAAILHEYNYRCVVQSHFRIIAVTDRAPFSPSEFLYLLSTPFVQRQIRNLVFIQSTIGSIGRRLGELQIPCPSPSVEWQTRVEEFWSAVRQRAKLLKRLLEFQVPEVEL